MKNNRLYRNIINDISKSLKRKLLENYTDDLFNDIYDPDEDETYDIIGKQLIYKYFPKTKSELKKLLEQLLEERGPDADLNDIDTSHITDMSYLFNRLDPHNIDIFFWDVSNVEDMSCMFSNCFKFNSNLENWDVSKVTNMSYMFYNCEKFMGKGLKNWNVSKVINMSDMFSGCEKFTGKGLKNWKVSKVTNMRYMFFGCENFNSNLSNWDVSNVEDMRKMFHGCEKFTGQGLGNWNVNVSKVRDMSYMFFGCENFDCNLSDWHVSNVTDMCNMFNNCINFTGKGLGNWIVNIKDIKLSEMFLNCSNFNCDLSSWKIYLVPKDKRKNIFKGCSSLKNSRKYLKEPKIKS